MLKPLHILSSLLLLSMATVTLLHWLVTPVIPLWLSGMFGWVGLVVLLLSSPKVLFKQFFMLSAVGIAFLLWAQVRDSNFSLTQLVIQNNSLIVMLYCVGFLRLVASTAECSEALPQGRWAYLKTLLGVHILGSVINASILVMVSERLKPLPDQTKQSLVVTARGFSMAALWSPFFVAMAVALTYAPEAELLPVIGMGLTITALAMLVTLIEQGGKGLNALSLFRGYPTHLSNLWIPLLLATSVFVFHWLFPDLPVLMLVSSTALVLTAGFVFYHFGRQGRRKLQEHIANSAPRMTRELSLFMGAGVLTVGLQAFFGTLEGFQPFQQIGATELSILLGVGIGVSLIGVHPVVTIAIIGPMVQSLESTPNQLATLFLCIWSFGVIANPYSGVNAVLRGHFDVSSTQIVRWNIVYVVSMWVVVSMAFRLVS